MMDKQKIVIDSCVFFHMLKYNDIFEKDGLKAVVAEGLQDQKEYEKTRAELDNFMTTVLKDKQAKSKIPFTFDKKLSLCDSLLSNKSTAFPQDIKDEYKKLHDAYAKAKTYSFVGELFHRHKTGYCDFYLSPTSIDEIKYHRDLPKDKRRTEEEKQEYFDADRINNFARTCCKKLNLTEEMKRDAAVLSEILRGKIELDGLELPKAPMGSKKSDMNKNGVFGDSLIMAECGVAGMTLVTQNAKDFIFDKGIALDEKGVQNTARRDGIEKIFNHLGISKEARPYTVEEFLNKTASYKGLEKTLDGDDGFSR